MTDKQRVVAAVDFGTHGTGFAWAIKDAPTPEIFYYDEWDLQPAHYPKNLTALLIDKQGSVTEWGYAARARDALTSSQEGGYSFHVRFKMGLKPDNPEYDHNGSDPHDVADSLRLTTLYLQQIYRVALEHIVSRAIVRAEQISWGLTIPAIWSNRERQLMRTAAERAGFPAGDRLKLTIEPEAAALHCWDDPAFTGIATPGSRFVVVDAGSGTVDITSYQVVGTPQRPRLAELGRPSGGKLGAGRVDGHFLRKIVAQRLGSEPLYKLTDNGSSKIKLMDEWERAKRAFDPNRQSPLNVTLPPMILRMLYTTHEEARARLAGAQNGIDEAIVLQPAETRALFDLVIDEMLALVDQHLRDINASRSERILLVGGFVESQYLQVRFKERFRSRVAEVLIAPRPAYAVLLGAVKWGLRPDTLVSRIMTHTYGVDVRMPFEQGIDTPDRYHIDGYGEAWCRDRFSIFVRSGQSVEVGTPVSQRFYPTDPQDTSVRLDVYAMDDASPRYVNSPGSEKIGTLNVDVSSTVNLPAAEREILVTMIFGDSEITVRGKDLHSGCELSTSINFVTAG